MKDAVNDVRMEAGAKALVTRRGLDWVESLNDKPREHYLEDARAVLAAADAAGADRYAEGYRAGTEDARAMAADALAGMQAQLAERDALLAQREGDAAVPEGWKACRVSDDDVRLYAPDGESWLLRSGQDGFDGFAYRLALALAAAPQPSQGGKEADRG